MLELYIYIYYIHALEQVIAIQYETRKRVDEWQDKVSNLKHDHTATQILNNNRNQGKTRPAFEL